MYEINILSGDKKEGYKFLDLVLNTINSMNVTTLPYPDFENPNIFSYFIRIFNNEEKVRVQLYPLNIKLRVAISTDKLENFNLLFSNIHEGVLLIDTLNENIIKKFEKEASKKNIDVYCFEVSKTEHKVLILMYFLDEFLKLFPFNFYGYSLKLLNKFSIKKIN
ncbi:MAG: hypothetical protein ABDH49_07760 [Candidatus Hydrothermales bacterium]